MFPIFIPEQNLFFRMNAIIGFTTLAVSNIDNQERVKDYLTKAGTTIFLAAFIIIMNLVVDLLYKLVDPRINLGKGGN